MIYLKTEMEKMPVNCVHCLCGCKINEKFLEEMANEALTDEEWNIKRQKAIQNRLPDCPLSEDTWKARCEGLMGLIRERKYPDHVDCNCDDCRLNEQAKKIMEGKV